MQNTVIYQGRIYRSSKTNPKYFYADVYNGQGKAGRKKIALHRQVYIDNFGEIPAYHDVHHINGDTNDNDPSNLSVIHRSTHRSAHQKQRANDPKSRHIYISALDDNRHKAAEWHNSKEGREWHSENAKKAWDKRRPTLKTCSECGIEMEVFFERKQYCGSRCAQRASAKKKRNN